MPESANKIFFGCNYNDKKIKAQFDNLKKRIEQDMPISCIVVDKRKKKPARDLWTDIRADIENSAACVFDLTGFRPNVVLELGYALSVKSKDQIFITFRKRKKDGGTPQWFLSDIGHLQRFDYINIPELERHVREQIRHIPYLQNYETFLKLCEINSSADKYKQVGLDILKAIRDEEQKTMQQLKRLMVGSGCNGNKIIQLLRAEKLVARGRGPNGRFTIPTSNNKK